MRWQRTLAMLTVPFSVWPTGASAECVNNFGPGVMLNDRYSFIFDGTVLALNDVTMNVGGTRPLATIQVHRVFKGQLPTQIEVRHWDPGFEFPDLEIGKRYVLGIDLFGQGSDHGPPDHTTWYGTTPCGGALRETLQKDGALDGFGPGWPPKG